jgi:hypothetical protein
LPASPSIALRCGIVHFFIYVSNILSEDVADFLLKYLQSTSILEQRLQVALLGLQIRVSTNVLLRNEDAGHGSLARHFAEGALDR